MSTCEEVEASILAEMLLDGEMLAKIDARAAKDGLSRWEMIGAMVRALVALEEDEEAASEPD